MCLKPDSTKSYEPVGNKYTTTYLPKDSPLIEDSRKAGLTVYVYETKIIEVLPPYSEFVKKDFRENIIVSCSSCNGMEMEYDPHYLTFRCPKCKRIINMRQKK